MVSNYLPQHPFLSLASLSFTTDCCCLNPLTCDFQKSLSVYTVSTYKLGQIDPRFHCGDIHQEATLTRFPKNFGLLLSVSVSVLVPCVRCALSIVHVCIVCSLQSSHSYPMQKTKGSCVHRGLCV